MRQYQFSRRIGRGGMAEVFLGMQEGFGGFEKLVVIKRIFPQYSEDENFVRMFLDEARLAASIRHPNVVQILDIGRDDRGFFMVMEYLSGETVGYAFEALRALERQIPSYVACRIGAEIAAGLHHAHTATDAAGNPQPIVHRDVTPSNLIVCWSGLVKVLDFGVAKATLSDGHTQVGALKGKMSYLAPEQVLDFPVDGRTDVFQLGICLHEMLTGRRLFAGDSDQQKMSAVMEKPITPPSRVVPGIPPALDDVVLWALERDPERRPQSADALRRELEAVLRHVGATVSDHDLGEWMQATFPQRRAERLAMERASVAQMRDRRSSDAGSASSSAQIPVHAGGDGTGQRTPTLATVLQRPGQHSSTASTSLLTARQGWIVAAVLSLFVAAVSVSAWQLGGEGAAGAGRETIPAASAGEPEAAGGEEKAEIESQTASASEAEGIETEAEAEAEAESRVSLSFEVEVRALPREASISLDGQLVGTGVFRTELPADGRRHELLVIADGYRARTLSFVDEPPPEVIELEPKRRRREASRRGKQGDDGAERARQEESRQPPPPEREEPRPLTDNLDPWAE